MAAGKVWRTASVDESLARRLASDLGLPGAIGSVLVARGISSQAIADSYLRPRLSTLSDPFLLPAMARAVDRILDAVARHETIAIYGDYDVDGITSTALMCHVLGRMGAKVAPFLPLRLEEGYGLTVDGLERCMESIKPSLIVTVDCGTGSVAAVQYAAKLGVDIVVTDHHAPPAEVAPAYAVVNPKLAGDQSLHMLAGVGVAFKLCHALAKRGRDRGDAIARDLDLKQYLDLVALGTIADIVPLQGENRTMARHGLAQMNKTQCLGLATLARVAGVEGKIDAYEVGFRLGPRLNAAGRLGDALHALELLTTSDAGRAIELSEALDAANRERQDIEAQMVRQALADATQSYDPVRDMALVIAGENWHPGVIGIVATRVVQRFNRPAICIAIHDGKARGSGRSIEGVDIVGCLNQCSSLLLKFGGHAMAAGLEINPESIGAFRERFNSIVKEAVGKRDLRPVQKVDAWVAIGDVDERLLKAMDEMRPFGVGNATPVWAARGVHVVGKPRIVGQGHLKLLIASGGHQREAIGFGLGDRAVPDGPLDVAFQAKRDTFMGNQKIVLQLQDFRPSQLAD